MLMVPGAAFLHTFWMARAIERVGAMGGIVVAVFDEGNGRGEINYPNQFRWLTDRFADKPIMDACA